jgi:bifunctional enzyme CysN/CysC
MSDGDVVWSHATLDRGDRWRATGLRGATVWFTGLPGSGKSTVSDALEGLLHERGRAAYRLDGDNLRHGLNADLGFDAASRAENVRRVGEVTLLLADAGLVTLVALVSPYSADRDRIRARHVSEGLVFCEVHVATPAEVCAERDPKGHWARALAGEMRGFTGVDDPYEAPPAAEVTLWPGDGTPVEMAQRVLEVLERLEDAPAEPDLGA